MHIICEKKFRKEGNDCIINSILTLIEIFDVYCLFQHVRYYGSWVDDKVHKSEWEFSNKKEALDEFNNIAKELAAYETLD